MSKTAASRPHTLAGMTQPTATTIVADFEITAWDQAPYDNGAGGPQLGRATVHKTFTGPLAATSVAELLLCGGEGGQGYVASERVTGTLDEREGTFVIQHGGIAAAGDDGHTFGHVVPGSGTGELAGLRGKASYRHDDAVAQLTLTYTL
jgi:hypothetical protein